MISKVEAEQKLLKIFYDVKLDRYLNQKLTLVFFEINVDSQLTEFIIPGYDIFILLGIGLITSLIVIKKQLKSV